jgi:hypothetical protein
MTLQIASHGPLHILFVSGGDKYVKLLTSARPDNNIMYELKRKGHI